MRFATFNIHHGQGSDLLPSLRRIARVIETIDPDAIGLNEVWHGRGPFDQVRMLKRYLNMDSFYGGNHEGVIHGLGNLVFTRGRIVESENIMLPYKGEIRGCALVLVDDGERRFRFASTHMSLHRETRRRQFEFMCENLPRDLPLVLAGDFNCTPKELGPLRECLTPAEPFKPTFNAVTPTRTIDYVFYDEAHWRLEGLGTVRTLASDHVPVVADLRPL